MSKIILDSIAGGYNLNKINDNFDTIADTINNQVLFRDNPEGEPNSLQSDIDCNSKNLLNVGDLRVLGSASLNGINFDAVNSAFVWRGAWDSGTTYAVSDGVSYNGSSYIATAVSTNSAPPSANWDVLAGKGDPGDVTGSGTSVVGRVVTFANTSGDLLSDGGILLSALATKGTLASSGITGAAESGANATITSVTALASINGGQLAGFRNKIINGNMAIRQRATPHGSDSYSFSPATIPNTLAVPGSTTGYYWADRWFAYLTGGAGTGTISSSALGSYNVRSGPLVITGAAGVTASGIGQRIESCNCYDLAGKNCTISVQLSSTNLTSIGWKLSRANTADVFGTMASPSTTTIASGTFTVNTTLTRYTATVTGLPAEVANGLELQFTFGALITGSVSVNEVQLEVGDVASSFEYRNYSIEMAMCQRYCTTLATSGVDQLGYARSASLLETFPKRFPSYMRSNGSAVYPTATYSWTAGGAFSAGQCSALQVSTASYLSITGTLARAVQLNQSDYYWQFTASSTFSATPGAILIMNMNLSSLGPLYVSAEL